MRRILVVDDSEFDLAIFRKVFRTLGNWDVEFVSEGGVALARMQEQKLDLILTDMHMPRMTGLDLLKCVHERQLGIPVVVMTSKGSEQIAMEALRSGAANYVIKKNMVLDLPAIIETVMRSQHSAEMESQLLASLSHAEFRFTISNERSLINAAIRFIQDASFRFGKLPISERTRLGIGLEEALTNSMIHGNLNVSSELRQDGSNAYEQLIAQRKNERPYSDRKLDILVRFEPEQLTCHICDQGAGFDVMSVPDPTDPETMMRPSGRGMLLIRSFMDDVFYNDKGNQITLCKKLPGQLLRHHLQSDGNGPTTGEIAELRECRMMQETH